MSAIITNTFRRQSCQRFIDNIQDEEANSTGYYIGLGKSDQWREDESSYEVPLPNGAPISEQDIKDNLMALVKVASYSKLFPRNEMRTGRTYKVYNPTDPLLFDLEGHYYPSVATHNDKVYVCLSNNNKGSISEYPTGTTYGTEVLVGDDYIWAYLQDVVTTSDFYTDEFIPVGATPGDTTPAKAATGGLVYGFDVEEGGTGLPANPKVYLRGIDENGVVIPQIDLQADPKFTVTISSNSITDIAYNDFVNDKLTGYHKASIEVYDDSDEFVESVKIRPIVAKIEGFGSDPMNELPAYYVGCYAKFKGNVDGEAVTDVPFRQISLIKNPTRLNQSGDDGYDYEDAEALDALSYLQLNTDEATQSHPSGSIITQGNAIAYLDKVDLIKDRIYYHTNSNYDVNYVPLVDDADLTITYEGGSTDYSQGSITSVEPSEYIHNSGDVVFVDQRAMITRNVDQTEDIKIVIQF